MKWFGKSWGAPVCTERERYPWAPQVACVACKQRVKEDERGVLLPFIGEGGGDLSFVEIINHDGYVAYHLDCFARAVGVKE